MSGNDAIAAALGELAFWANASPAMDLLYVNLGTGVSSAQVYGGVAANLDLGHMPMGATWWCPGGQAMGCMVEACCAQKQIDRC
jgi:predicted NBD/HSP70 family sugar kinase